MRILLILFLAASPVAAEPNIRMLILKHSKEHMADGDADLAITATQKAAAKGMNIKVVGNYFVNNRPAPIVVFNFDDFRTTVQKFAKADSNYGDTLIVFTIGHGSPDGNLHNLGQRSGIMKILAETAEDQNQKILWWQLSCHAAAKLPTIESLNPKQQRLFSVLATSTAAQQSAAYVQGKIMEKLFLAIAEKSKSIDPNGDNIITATEMKNFLNEDGRKRGDLLFTQSLNFPVFGGSRINLPVRDRNNPQGKYQEDYILFPDP